MLYRGSMVNIAERLWRIRAEELWSGTWSSWEEFLENLGIKKGTASKLCTLYERIVVQLKFPTETLHSAPWTNLYQALPMMTDGEKAKSALAIASTLTSKEINQELYEHKHGRECSHDHFHFLKYCEDCKAYIRVYDPVNA